MKMKYKIDDLLKEPLIELNEDLKFDDELLINIYNIKSINNTNIIGTIRYENQILLTNIIINSSVNVICAKSGRIFNYDFKHHWNEKYSFFINNKEANYINEQVFDVKKYTLDEIFYNIASNLSIKNVKINNRGKNWQLLSDQDLDQLPENNDDQWEKLKTLKIKEK